MKTYLVIKNGQVWRYMKRGVYLSLERLQNIYNKNRFHAERIVEEVINENQKIKVR